MELGSNQSFIKLVLKEAAKEDCDYEILRKLADYLQILEDNSAPTAAITITTEGFIDIDVGAYTIREDGNGNTIGLFKKVDGRLEQITFPLKHEVKLIKGSGTGELTPPKGWRFVDDAAIINKYNIGVAPNYKLAAIEYIGI